MATGRRSNIAPSRRGGANTQSSGVRGDAVFAAMEEEGRRQAARKEQAEQTANMPFRFFLTPGESREIVVVDDKPDFARYEHNLKNRKTGKYDIYCACINENANCPVCSASDRPSYFGMFLTIIDLTPYEDKNGNEVEWSKKLLCVKPQQQKKFMRLLERHGSLRGMVLQMSRDGDKDASIGNEIEFIEFMEEDQLLAYEVSYDYETRDGVKKTRDIIGHEPFDYDELFPAPTEEQLAALVGGSVNTRDEEDRQIGRGRTSSRTAGGRGRSSGDDWQQDAPRRRPAEVVQRRSAVRRDDPPDDAGDEPQDEAPPARRGAVTRRAPVTEAPVRREVVSHRTAPEPEDDLPEDEAPPPRRSAAPTQRRVAVNPVQRRAAAREEAQDDDQQDDPPQRSAASLADRRRQLRGGR